jgi:hypothetical protein
VNGRIILGDAPAAVVPDAVESLAITGQVATNAFITSQQDVTLTVAKTVRGTVNVVGSLNITVAGAVAGASIIAGNDLTFKSTGAVVRSSVVAGQGILVGSQLLAGATSSEFLGGNGVDLGVTGSLRSTRFSGGEANLELNISGSVFNSQFVAGGDAEITVGFTVSRSSVLSDGRLELSIGRQPQGAVVGVGDLISSLVGSKSTSAIVSIGGKVSGSQFTTGTDLVVTAGGDVEANVVQTGNNLTFNAAANVLRSRFVVGSDAAVTVGGQVASSSLLISNNLTATIGLSGAPIVLRKAPPAGLIGSRIETSDGNSDVTVIGPVANTLFESGQDAALRVSDLVGLDAKTNQPKIVRKASISANVVIATAGSASVQSSSLATAAARVTAGGSASIDVAGLYAGSIGAAENVTLIAGSVALAGDFTVPVFGTYPAAPVPGAVPPSATSGTSTPPPPALPGVPGSGNSVKIVARGGLRAGQDLVLLVDGKFTSPLVNVGGNVLDFQVGGALSSRIYVGGNFGSGDPAAAATVVGGVVSPITILHIGGDLGTIDSATQFVFAKGFAGRLEVGGDLRADLTFQGSVNRLEIGGSFDTTPGNAVADIVVQGRLQALAIASPFTRTSTTGGTFAGETGIIAGIVNASGGAISVGLVA